jgi:hypothetical protein
MAWPSSADIDTTKLDNDNDSIKDSRAELYKMAGYVNDMITTGPGGSANLQTNSIIVGYSGNISTVTIGVGVDNKSLTLEGGGDNDSTGHIGPSITLAGFESGNIILNCVSGGTLQLNSNAIQTSPPGGYGNTVVGYYKVIAPGISGPCYIELKQ